MKLVWTFDSMQLKHKKDWQFILINYYLESIKKAKELGYYTIIYTNIDCKNYFIKIADEVIVLTNSDSPLFDWMKIEVLKSRTDTFCLIDGDLILHKRLPEFTSDLVYDSPETNAWGTYNRIIKLLDTIDIGNEIDYWSTKKVDVFNCGILYINNTEFKELYIKNWEIANKFVKNNISKFTTTLVMDNLENFERNEVLIGIGTTTYHATATCSQYYLTILANQLGISTTNLQKETNIKGDYYIHYTGGEKYKNPKVPLIIKNKTLL
jgi:hypothetical protein